VRSGPGLLARLRRAVLLLASRDVAVLLSAIAFNVLLCLFPLLLVLVAAGQRLSPAGGTSHVLSLLLAELIPFGGETIAASLRQMTRVARSLELLSLALVVWGSSGVFLPVELVLDRVWSGGGPRSFWKSRLLAFLLTVAGGALALVSVGLTLVVRGFGKGWPALAGSAAKAGAFLLSLALFLLVYRLVPRARVSLGTALRAALWAAVLWEVSKYAFVWNLPRLQLQAFYGPLAFAVALVLWAYVSSVVLVFGAAVAPGPAGRGR
jgi:membrane protein/epoxyqueuosine reductase